MEDLNFFSDFQNKPIKTEFIATFDEGKRRTCVKILDKLCFSYRFYRKSLTTQTWRCNKRTKFDCRVAIKTNNNQIVSQTNLHTHKPEELENAVPVDFHDVVQSYFKY